MQALRLAVGWDLCEVQQLKGRSEMAEEQSMKSLITFIAKSLVDDPMEVVVSEEERDRGFRYQLSVAEEDMGRVIGKGGRVANAMRTLLRVAAARKGTRASLDIV